MSRPLRQYWAACAIPVGNMSPEMRRAHVPCAALARGLYDEMATAARGGPQRAVAGWLASFAGVVV